MGNPSFPNSQFNQSANSTAHHHSFVWDTSSLNHSTQQAVVGANVSLNSGYLANSLNQNWGMPMSGQLGLAQHVAQGRIPRNNLTLGSAIRDHGTPNSQPSPKKIVNFNIFVGNNSSTNINFLTNSIPPQFTRNNQVTCLPIAEQAQPRNMVFWPAPSSSPTLYTPVSVSAMTRGLGTYIPDNSQRIPNALPYLRQQQYSSSHQQQSQGQLPSTDLTHHAISQNNLNLGLSSLRSSFHTENNYHLPTLLGSSNSSNNRRVDFARGNDTLGVGRFHSQPNLLAPPENLVAEHVRNQVSDPSVKHPSLSKTHEPFPPNPTQNAIVNGPQQEAQDSCPNHINESPAKEHKQSAIRRKSHPYIKYGPYTCPFCRAIFKNRHCFAAHFQKHYRDESPEEQKRRHESEMENKDMPIIKTTAGIATNPKSPCLEDKLLVKPDTANAQVINVEEGEGVALSGKIKQEEVTEYKN